MLCTTVNLHKKLLIYFLRASARGMVRVLPSYLINQRDEAPQDALKDRALRAFPPQPQTPLVFSWSSTSSSFCTAFGLEQALLGPQEKCTDSAVFLFTAAFQTTSINRCLIHLTANLFSMHHFPFSRRCMRVHQTPLRSHISFEFSHQNPAFQSARYTLSAVKLRC